MIDEKLVALTIATRTKLAGMKDARPSEIMAVKEQFGADVLALLKTATASITAAQKIAFFDNAAASHIEQLTAAVNNALKGEGFHTRHEDDEGHWAWEAIRAAVIGPKAFKATNEFESLLPLRTSD